MKSPNEAAEILEQTFNRILTEKMVGIPILNTALRVQVLGFQEYQGRTIGVLITPWLMNLVVLPGDGDDWSGLELGKKQQHMFPSNTYRFMVNEIDGIGKCQTHPLYSPMNEFIDQAHAVAAAQGFLAALMVEKKPEREDLVDEELLGRILRGESTSPVSSDKSVMAIGKENDTQVKKGIEERARVDQTLSRRELLSGVLPRESG